MKDLVPVADRAVLPIDVWRELPSDAEFVLLRPKQRAQRLAVRIEGERDADVEDRLNQAIDLPVDVEWVPTGTFPRAAYKSQRVVDVD